MSTLSGGRKPKLRYRIAAVCAIAGIVLTFAALRFRTKDYLKLTQIEQRSGPAYSRLWFDGQNVLAGAVQQGTKLSVDRWAAGGAQSWNAELGASEAKWAVAPDFSRIAWIAASRVYWQNLSRGAHIEAKNATGSARLPKGPDVLALNMLSDGSVAIVLSDATVRRWDATGKSLPDWRTALKSADQAVADENYLAISSIPERRMLLYRLGENEDWSLQDQSTPPDPPFQLVIPARGVMATLSAEGLQMGGKTWNSPGAVRSVGSRKDDVIATGEFDQVLVLTSQLEKDERYSLAEAAPGSLVAISPTQLAVSGPSGTTLFNVLTEMHLTTTGRQMTVLSLILLLAGVVLACWVLLLDGVQGLAGGVLHRLRKGTNPRRFPDPTGELIKACAMGQTGLWAGAGLSAQSGLPLRCNFIANLLQATSIEGILSHSVHRKLVAKYTKGDAEGALTGLIAAAPRSDMISYFRAILYRRVAPSRCHKLLAQVPFSSAMTTNYDFLFQQAGSLWAAATATLRGAHPAAFPDRAKFLKLYGDLDDAETLLLSRAEFESALKYSPAKNSIQKILREHPVLFIGCSLDGLLADLDALGVEETRWVKHFALTGVSGNSWQGRAEELKRRFGIEVFACDMDAVQTALVEYLEKLVGAVKQQQKKMAPPTPLGDVTRTNRAASA
jgi:hypothetical protein